MVWEPALKGFVVVKVALPALFTVTIPRIVEPSLKVAVPVGVPLPPPLAATKAVKLMDWPKMLGLSELVRVVFVGLLFTTCIKDAVDGLKLASPL